MLCYFFFIHNLVFFFIVFSFVIFLYFLIYIYFFIIRPFIFLSYKYYIYENLKDVLSYFILVLFLCLLFKIMNCELSYVSNMNDYDYVVQDKDEIFLLMCDKKDNPIDNIIKSSNKSKMCKIKIKLLYTFFFFIKSIYFFENYLFFILFHFYFYFKLNL